MGCSHPAPRWGLTTINEVIMLKLETKGADLRKLARSIDSVTLRKAERMAINDAARKARTAARKKIRQAYNLPAARVRREVDLSRLASSSKLEARLAAKGRPIGLANFGARMVRGNVVTTKTKSRKTKRRGKNQGVTVEIMKGRRTTLAGAWMAAGRRGAVDGAGAVRVFRVNKAGQTVAPASISIATMYRMHHISRRVSRVIMVTMHRRFEHHLRRLAGV